MESLKWRLQYPPKISVSLPTIPSTPLHKKLFFVFSRNVWRRHHIPKTDARPGWFKDFPLNCRISKAFNTKRDFCYKDAYIILKSDWNINMDHMLISGIEPSLVILRHKNYSKILKYYKKLLMKSTKIPPVTVTVDNGLYKFRKFQFYFENRLNSF